MFVHLTAHSYYSLQEGLASPEELVGAAASAGMTALGLTDHRLLTGTVEFAAACKEAGVQPVYGLEVDWEGGPLALLATSLEGWANLCRLSSGLALREDPEAEAPFEMLVEYAADLIALRGETGEGGLERLGRLKEIFPERLYAAMTDPGTALASAGLARKAGLP